MQPESRDDEPAEIDALERELVALLRYGRRAPDLRIGERTIRLPLQVYLLLLRLYEAGPMRSVDLAREAGLDKSTMSRHVASLERSGLVVRVEDPDDGRAALVTLSEPGRERITEVRTMRRHQLRALLADWPAADRRDCARLLARLNTELATLSADPPTAPQPAVTREETE